MSDARKSARQDDILLDAHLPLDRRRAEALGATMPGRSSGTALLADVSGFTPLMEHLASTLGPQQGAEELTRLLNALFASLVGEVHRHGGSIVAFGGDALTCWFPGSVEETAVRAVACALAMQRHTGAFGPVDTPAGPTPLSMHVGVASGEVRRLCVGRPPHGLQDVLAGATVERMARAQQRAGSGQAVLDTTTAGMLPAEDCAPLGGGFCLLVGAPGTVLTVSPEQVAPLPPLPARRVRRWLAQPLYRRLRAGGGEFAAEFRLVASLFVRFAGLNYEADPVAGRKLRQYVAAAQERLAQSTGRSSERGRARAWSNDGGHSGWPAVLRGKDAVGAAPLGLWVVAPEQQRQENLPDGRDDRQPAFLTQMRLPVSQQLA